MQMFEVRAKCGHVGKNLYTEKAFAIKAENAKEAAAIARWIPRVKHHHSDAILSVVAIEIDRFNEIIESNNTDPYFTCHSIQEQRQYEIDVFAENCKESRIKEREDSYAERPIYYGKEKIRNPKKYLQHYAMEA